MIETEQMGIVPEFNNNMSTKNFLRATLLAATLVVAGYGGMKAYDYSYARKVNSDDAMLIANIEALTQDEEPALTGYGCFHIPCYQVVVINGAYYTIESGKYRAVAFENPYSNSPRHAHDCSDCKSESH